MYLDMSSQLGEDMERATYCLHNVLTLHITQ